MVNEGIQNAVCRGCQKGKYKLPKEKPLKNSSASSVSVQTSYKDVEEIGTDDDDVPF